MKILAIDYGKKWIGLAISDDGRRLAFAYKTLENNSKTFSVLNEIIKKEEIYKIVIGLPLNKEMKPTQQTTETENWAQELIKKVATPTPLGRSPDRNSDGTVGESVGVDFENEIFTSKAADKLGVKNQHAAAAAIFLQDYLDRNNK
ncbi:MAG: pre-16S rRNA-processing nuclease YqgF [Parcubacteria group bacterium]|nr:pre-16S rRNA-processing nuclease YqgF [Parcubacteria group bacterium]